MESTLTDQEKQISVNYCQRLSVGFAHRKSRTGRSDKTAHELL